MRFASKATTERCVPQMVLAFAAAAVRLTRMRLASLPLQLWFMLWTVVLLAPPCRAFSGVSWQQISSAACELSTGRMTRYGYDGRGNRTSQGAEVAQTANGLAQVTARTLTSRGFGLLGSVTPAAKLYAQTSLAASWQKPTTDPVTGAFANWWDVPLATNAGRAVRIEALLRGILPGAPPAIADATVDLVVPPASESLSYDGVGQLQGDAFWSYTWDGAGRLVTLTRKAGTFAKANALSETLAYGYDADGRRTSRTHITSYPGEVTETEHSTVLWAGSLPVLELRTKDSVNLGRRWFQWGPDLSGTLEGAGGTGGLAAIVEEDMHGAVKRTLLPVGDGLGNVTAVIDAASGQTVAKYEYGPFGEPLGGSGEADACPFRWQTKWYDTASAQYYFGYRHYDPRTGRWLSRDPAGEAGGFNLYGYCGNDPVNRHDALGLDTIQLASPDAALLKLFAPHHYSGMLLSGETWTENPDPFTVGSDLRLAQVQAANLVRYGVPMMRLFGGAAETVAGIAGAATLGPPGWIAGPAAALNGFDNSVAGLRSMASGTYQPSWLESEAVSHLGPVAGNWTYAASQVALGAAPALARRISVLQSASRVSPLPLLWGRQGTFGAVETELGAFGGGPGAMWKGELLPGRAGSFSELDSLRVTGDGLTLHHIPQAALEFTSYGEGGALMLPQAIHVLTRTYGTGGRILAAEEAGLSFRSVLARDIRDVRSLTGSEYNYGLQDLLDYYRRNFRELIAKPK